jgi:hypothetical protein
MFIFHKNFLFYIEVELNSTDEPVNIHMQFLENRLKSFIDKNWDKNIPVTDRELCEARFYYLGEVIG